jgi:hypothetical protein
MDILQNAKIEVYKPSKDSIFTEFSDIFKSTVNITLDSSIKRKLYKDFLWGGNRKYRDPETGQIKKAGKWLDFIAGVCHVENKGVVSCDDVYQKVRRFTCERVRN